MAENVIKSLSEDFVHCTICKEPYKEPKMLPCLHSFCLNCLAQWANNRQGQPLVCPTCRCAVDLPSTGVNGLPKNFFLVSLMERLEEASRLSTQHQDYNCHICRNKMGAMFCLDCKMHICHGCKETHNRLTRSTDHPMIPSEKISDENYLQRVMSTQAPYCKTHNQQKTLYYCLQCNQLACQVCATVSHQGHQTLEEVENKVTAVKAQLETHLEQSKSQVTDVQDKLRETKRTTDVVTSDESELLIKIDAQYEEFVAKLQSDREKLREKLRQIKNEKCATSADTETEISHWLKAMANTQEITRRILKQNNPWEILEMERNAARSFSRLQKDKDRIFRLSLPRRVDLTFSPSKLTVLDKDKEEILRKAELQGKGQSSKEERGAKKLKMSEEENWIGHFEAFYSLFEVMNVPLPKFRDYFQGCN